jgi:hypothetical protein
MKTWPRALLLLMLGTAVMSLPAAPDAPRAITEFLPALRAAPTWADAPANKNVRADYSKFPDWVAARIEFQEWIERDPLAPWVSLLKCRSRVPAADWQLLQRELAYMARFHVTIQYQILVEGWEGTPDPFHIRDLAGWQKHIDNYPRKLGLLTGIATDRLLNDWPTTTNFIWVQNVEAPRKAELIDIALKHWADLKGYDEPAAWLFAAGVTDVTWNLPATWLAVDCFPTKPDLAVKLLKRVDDPVMKQVAVLAIAAQTADAASLEPLRPFADTATWKLITTR